MEQNEKMDLIQALSQALTLSEFIGASKDDAARAQFVKDRAEQVDRIKALLEI